MGEIFDIMQLAGKLAKLAVGKTQPEVSDLGFLAGYKIELRKTYYGKLLRGVSTTSEARILECGCGGGGVLLALRDAGYTDLTGIDTSKVGLALAHERCPDVNYFLGDFHDITPSFGVFDIIIFAQVLEHLSGDQDIRILQQLFRNLSPQGYFVCGVPHLESFPLCHEHARQYSREIVLLRYSQCLSTAVDIFWVGASDPKYPTQQNILFTIRRKDRTRR